jgi:hypothetical protein
MVVNKSRCMSDAYPFTTTDLIPLARTNSCFGSVAVLVLPDYGFGTFIS